MANGGAGREISVVVPVYRAEATLRELHARLVAVLEELSDRFEIIMVEDAGGDSSWDVMSELASADPRVRGIQLARNSGQHNALLCGVRMARYGVVVTIDDDLQHPPEEMGKLLSKLDEGFDVVYGTPVAERHGALRVVASRLTKMMLQGVMGAETARSVSAFRAFRLGVREAFSHYHGAFVSLDVLLTWGTSRFVAIPVRHDARPQGRSNYTSGRLILHALNMITGFSTFPLQLASVVGFALTLMGAGVLIYVLGRYVIQGSSVAGFPFLASVVAIFSGGQLFALGVMGEYLARMHFRLMGRPEYVVRSSTAARDTAGGGHPGPPSTGSD
jgi:undecaprenyl-phosphate 4-deoxy-4-formamido-L-arabinose transferase